MKILLVNQFFYPDHSATAQLALDVAEDLVANGHEVTVVAGRGGYLGGVSLPARESFHGIDIVRVYSSGLGKRHLWQRALDYLSYLTMAVARTLALPRADVVLVMSTPPFVGVVGATLQMVKQSRFVYWVQDIYPDLAITLGVLRESSSVGRILVRLARALLMRADAVIAPGGAMARRLQGKGVDGGRIRIVPNWSDGRNVYPAGGASETFRRQHGIEGKKVVLYSGNFGLAHEMRTILAAASRLRERPEIVFLFVGDGSRRQEILDAAEASPNIRILPYQPRSSLAESLSAGDVHVVTQAPETLGMMEPSKLYGVLAVGRPVLYIGPEESEVAATITGEGVGRVIRNGDVDGAARAVLEMLDDSVRLGHRARVAFESRYDRHWRTASIESVLKGCIAHSGS